VHYATLHYCTKQRPLFGQLNLALGFEQMMSAVKKIVILLVIIVISACTINDINAIDEYQKPMNGRSLIIYGVGLEAVWSYPKFAVNIDEYDIKEQNISGNCWFYNRMLASVLSSSQNINYFLFDVEPGFYIYSGFNSSPLNANIDGAFVVPEGKTVYLGDFVYQKNQKVDFRNGFEKMKRALFREVAINDKVIIAKTIQVKKPAMFLCMP
jgi:hypothetical protein